MPDSYRTTKATTNGVLDNLLEQPAFGSVGLRMLAAPVLIAAGGGVLAGGGSLWLWATMFAVAMVLAVSALWAVRPTPAAIKSVLIDSKFFMPYCVCPECKTEGLHWLKTAAVARDDKSLLEFYKATVIANPTSSLAWLMPQREPMQLMYARQWADEREKKSDVIRECRDCGNTWGQKVGLDA